MTTKEFSAEFDILYNNIMSNIAPGVTEYEKSVFLTQAQEQLIIEIYSGQYKGEPFENSEEIRQYLKSLIQTSVKTAVTPFISEFPDRFKHFKVELDAQNFWFVILESVLFSGECPCTKGQRVIVKPVTYDEYWSITRNPFRGPNQSRVLRVNRSKNLIELISEYEIGEYVLKYLGRPQPIILALIEDAMTINGKSQVTECELPNVLHRTILTRAVQLAKSAWGQSQGQE